MVKPDDVSLKSALDMIKNNDEAIARWISHVVSPHVVGVVLTSAVALAYSDNPLQIFTWLLLLLPMIVIPPLGYVSWLVSIGKLEDIYMPNRERRLGPLTVLMIWLLICLGLMRYWQAPLIVEIFVLATTVMIGVLGLVTLFWKISFHGATISAAATATVIVAGLTAWPVMLLIPLVGWARVRLKRHTTGQVICGSIVGVLIAIVLAQSLIALV